RAGAGRYLGGAVGQVGGTLHARHGKNAAAGLRLLRWLQLRSLRAPLPAAQGRPDRSAYRRPVQGRTGRRARQGRRDACRGGSRQLARRASEANVIPHAVTSSAGSDVLLHVLLALAVVVALGRAVGVLFVRLG